MKIEISKQTKFDIGETVFYLDRKCFLIRSSSVQEISVTASAKDPKGDGAIETTLCAHYWLDNGSYVSEDDVYGEYQELVKAITE